MFLSIIKESNATLLKTRDLPVMTCYQLTNQRIAWESLCNGVVNVNVLYRLRYDTFISLVNLRLLEKVKTRGNQKVLWKGLILSRATKTNSNSKMKGLILIRLNYFLKIFTFATFLQNVFSQFVQRQKVKLVQIVSKIASKCLT